MTWRVCAFALPLSAWYARQADSVLVARGLDNAPAVVYTTGMATSNTPNGYYRFQRPTATGVYWARNANSPDQTIAVQRVKHGYQWVAYLGGERVNSGKWNTFAGAARQAKLALAIFVASLA